MGAWGCFARKLSWFMKSPLSPGDSLAASSEQLNIPDYEEPPQEQIAEAERQSMAATFGHISNREQPGWKRQNEKRQSRP